MADRGALSASSRAARAAASLACAAAVIVAGLGWVKGTKAAGGSDSSCYALMADAFAEGTWQPALDLASRVPWPDAPHTLAPAGFVPSPRRPDRASPVCAPGFALVLAPFRWLGRDAIFAVTPVAGGLLVWLAFVFGRQLAGSAVGLASALVTSTIPVALFQVVQPMNDVLVAALWLAVLTAASLPEPTRTWAVGGLTGFAMLVRPNLAPAAVIVAGWLAWVLIQEHGWTPMVRRSAIAFALAALPCVGMALTLNAVLYGHPLRSGYGSIGDLFAVANLPLNLSRYGTALWQTELGFPLLGVLALVTAPRRRRSVVRLAVLVSAAIAAVYLVYQSFPEWWYLRFLLPAIVPMTVLACAAVVWSLASMLAAMARVAPAIGLALAIGLSLYQVRVVEARHVLDLQRLEHRFRLTGDVVRDRLPGRAIYLSVWESGTVRYHAQRQAVMWDALAADRLDGAVQWLTEQGFEPLFLLEQWEEPLFRDRFAGHSMLGDLDWPPRFEIERQVRIYDPRDREPFRRGENIATEFVLSR
jgi:hypothetical protein